MGWREMDGNLTLRFQLMEDPIDRDRLSKAEALKYYHNDRLSEID
jgi:hypothetical protein